MIQYFESIVMLIIAHRGASNEAPENTLEAFERAIQIGVPWIELDVQLTQDGLPVVHHDPIRCKQPHTPTLEETLKHINGRTALMVEIKGPLSKQVIQLANSYSGHLILGSDSASTLRQLAHSWPRQRTVAIVEQQEQLAQFCAFGCGYLALNHEWLTGPLVDQLRGQHDHLWAWTVDDSTRAWQLAEQGITGIITNQPRQLLLTALRRLVHLDVGCLTHDHPNWHCRSIGDLTLALAPIDDDSYNLVIRGVNPPQASQIEAATEALYSWGRPADWLVDATSDGDVIPLLSHLRWSHKKSWMAMAAPLTGCYTASPDLARVRELGPVAQVLEASGANPMALELILSQFPQHHFSDSSPIEWHLLYVDGEPVTTGRLTHHDGVALLSNVRTRPDQRRRGYGLTMMQSLMQRAQQLGCQSVLLCASPMANSLYAACGFKPLGPIEEYQLEAKISG
jgi:glycerophosphoryl diester phosphodiesterase